MLKIFFLNIAMKRISLESESKKKLNAALLSSIESVLPILSKSENRKSETDYYYHLSLFSHCGLDPAHAPYAQNFFFKYRNETDIIGIRIENQIQRRSFELDRVSTSDFIEVRKSKI